MPVREVSDHFVEALDESIKTRPYTTLAIVAGLAFLFGQWAGDGAERRTKDAQELDARHHAGDTGAQRQ